MFCYKVKELQAFREIQARIQGGARRARAPPLLRQKKKRGEKGKGKKRKRKGERERET